MLKRILIKASGEMLGGTGGYGLDQDSLLTLAKYLKQAHDTGAQLGIVIGAGNIMRGTSAQYLTRTKADSAGMLGTAINAIVLQDILQQEFQLDCIVLGAFSIDGMFQQSSLQLLDTYFTQKKVVIFAGGTGAPYFSTDTAGVLKALEMNADLMIKATKVDGVYDKDPHQFPDAKKYDFISYQEILAKKLNVMDFTATSLAMENNLPIRVVNLSGDNLVSIINKKSIGTLVSSCE